MMSVAPKSDVAGDVRELMQDRVRRVVVPLDGSERARTALRPAFELARHANVPLTVLMVVDDPTQHPAAEEQLQAEADAVAGDLAVEACVRIVTESPAIDIVSEAARDRALVCMASHGHGGFRQFVLGSVTEEVLRLSATPVLVVGPRIDRGRSVLTGPIVACLDGSDFAESVLPAAVSWASTLDLPLWLVSVIDPAFVEIDRFAPDDVLETAYLSHTARRLPVDAEWELLHGTNPARRIASFADDKDAAMLAVSTHGRTGLRRVAIGSVAMRIVHRSRCPVLMVRSRTLDA